jgi:ATP-dependent RNA helicase SUPV3L1/SUV3
MINKDKKSIINSFLDETNASKNETKEILERFEQSKLNRITKKNILTALNSIRFNKKLTAIKSELDVVLAKDFSMRFYYVYSFKIKEYKSFNKRVEIKILNVFNKELVEGKFELFLETIKNKKIDAIKKKKREIDDFKEDILTQIHPYLSNGDIYQSLLYSEFNNPYYATIPITLIESSFGKNRIKFKKSKANIIAKKYLYFNLYGVDIFYRVSVITKKLTVYKSLWKGVFLDFETQLKDMEEKILEKFTIDIKKIESILVELSQNLEIEKKDIESYILEFIQNEIEPFGELTISKQDRERFLEDFREHIKPIVEQRKKEELLAKTIRNFKNLFPLARSLNRKIIFHKGSTNSGKTYQALEHLKKAETGCYLAPLRLLALEVYDSLKENGVAISLITGEEQILDDDSTHVSSTVEMMNINVELDVAVIDEIQMIDDPQRGWAWTNALIGVPAKTVILTGSDNALKIVQELASYLEEPLEVVEFERMTSLELLSKPTPISEIEANTAVITFSRGEVLELRKKLSRFFEVSVIYGALSPEVRKEEARRFREGESQILVATDAISMGLNLPIKTVIFAKNIKFDGISDRLLTPSEITQIAGRAGRYGIYEKGFVGALNKNSLKTVSKRFNAPLREIELPLWVMANFEHVMLIGDILETKNIVRILDFFVRNMEFDAPFKTTKIDSMLEIGTMVNRYNFNLKTKFILTLAPVSLSSYYIKPIFERYLYRLEKDKLIEYTPAENLPKIAIDNDMMKRAEEQIKEISLYLWLSLKFPDNFTESKKAIQSKINLNRFIANSLREAEFEKRCKACNTTLSLSYHFSLCQACYALNF